MLYKAVTYRVDTKAMFVPCCGRLEEVAAAGKQAAWPEQLLQRRLLVQLQSMPAVSHLTPQELLSEYRALQLMAMYNGGNDTICSKADQAKCKLDAETEEFLVQQVGAYTKGGCA